MLRSLIAGLALVALSASMAGATGTTVYYRLYHMEGSSWVQYYANDPFPPGGNVSGTNRWRYSYEVDNVSAPGPVNTVYVFFNSDGVRHSDYPAVGTGAPGGWNYLYMAPPSGSQAWRERFRGLSAPIPVGGGLTGFHVDFTWDDPVLPGPQPFDSQTALGSETGTTIPVKKDVPVAAGTWGQLRKSYR